MNARAHLTGFERPPYNSAKGSLKGPTELGQVGVYHGQKGDSWYIVTKVGERGGTGGQCFLGPFAGPGFLEQLRSRTEYVPAEQLPDTVVAAIAVYALTGKVTRD